MNNEELDKLLPAYANNTLSDDEKRAVEAYLEQSESARNELALIRHEAKQIKKEPDELSTTIKSSMPSWAASLGVAAMLVIALQLTFVFQPTQDDTIDTELLNSMPAVMTEAHWLLQLAFDPTAKWSQISETLEAVNGVIIDGPSSMGLLRVAIPKSNPRFKESPALLSWLNKQKSIVHVALEDG